MKPSGVTLRFWGTRGSIPAPGMKTRRYGGNTSCVEVRYRDALLILDAGTGIRELGDSLLAQGPGPVRGHIFITHTHWDHIQGFPFFIPAYFKNNRFTIYGAHGMGMNFETVFRGLMAPAYFPVALGDMASDLQFRQITGEPFEADGVAVKTWYTNHPGMDVAYRFQLGDKSVTYLTDHETYATLGEEHPFTSRQDRDVADFCRGSDVLICDAQYTDEEYKKKRGWGHSRYRDTVALAVASQAKQLVLFHHDPYHTDSDLDAIGRDSVSIARKAKSKLKVLPAKDGLVIRI